MHGWLEKRGPLVDWSWDKRWCVLVERQGAAHEWLLEYYADSNCDVKKGDIVLHQETRAVKFKGFGAVGDGVKHVTHRPFGFTLDVDPTAGKDRHMYYFDAVEGSVLDAWIRAIAEAAGQAMSCHQGLMQISEPGSAALPLIPSGPPPKDADRDSDEDEDVDVLPDCAAAPERALKRRRVALSAEAYGEWSKPRTERPQAVPKTAEERQSIFAALQRSPFCMDLVRREEDCAVAIDAFQRVDAKAGDEVIRQGDTSDQCFYVLESGSIDVYLCRGEPHERHPGMKLRNLQSGSSFGELALLHHSPRAATLIANEACKLWALHADAFRYVMRDSAMRTRQRHFEFLRSIKLLEKLSDTEVGNLLDAVNVYRYQKGEYVVRVGELGDCFFVVEDGEAMARINGMDARAYKRGAYFGELSLLNDRPRAADIVATSNDLVVVSLDRGSFERILGRGVLFNKNSQEPPVLTNKAGPTTEAPRAKARAKDDKKPKRGLRFADDGADGEAPRQSRGRKGTGFVSVEQLQKFLEQAGEGEASGGSDRPVNMDKFRQLLEECSFEDGPSGASADGDAAGADGEPGGDGRARAGRSAMSDETGSRGSRVTVRFDAPGAENEKQRPRQGTGFIDINVLKALLEDAMEGSRDLEQSSVRFDEASIEAGDGSRKVARRLTPILGADELRKLWAGAEVDETGELRVRFDASVQDREASGFVRRGTGFVQAGQLHKLQEATGGDGAQADGHVRFDSGAECDGTASGPMRRGTGFVQAGQLQKLQNPIGDDGEDGDTAGEKALRWDPGVERNEGGALVRRGTGFVQADQARKLHEHDADGGVRFQGDVSAAEPRPLLRKGTGLVSAEQLRKFLEEFDAEVGGADARVRFETDDSVPEARPPMRKGTGCVHPDQVRRLLVEAGCGGGDEAHVTFDETSTEARGGVVVRKSTGFIHACQLWKLLEEAEGGASGSGSGDGAGVRFDAGTVDPPQGALVRKGTGFVSADQLRKLVAEAEACESGEVGGATSVRFDDSVEDREPTALARRGTGFVQGEQLCKLQDEDVEERAVRFDGSAEDREHSGLTRRGTGFIQSEQLQKLEVEGGDSEEEGASRAVRFDAPDNEGRESGAPARRGTGFIQGEQLAKLEEEGVDERAVRFVADAEDRESTTFMRRGTGFIQAEQAQKLSAEDEEEGGGSGVRFDAETVEREGTLSMRRGTGFIQSALVPQAEDDEGPGGVRFEDGTEGPSAVIGRGGVGLIQAEQV